MKIICLSLELIALDSMVTRDLAGHSIVINPNGDLVGELNESADILTVDLNLNEVEQQRENIPVFKSIKLDLYK